MKALVRAFQIDESGATAIEYGIIAALIAFVMISAVSLVGGEVRNMFEDVSSKVTNAAAASE